MCRAVYFSLGIAAFLLSSFLITENIDIYHPKPFDKAILTGVVRLVEGKGPMSQGLAQKMPAELIQEARDRIGPGPTFVLKLPPKLASASMTGRAYVSDGGRYVFIPSWMGRHTLTNVLESGGDSQIEGFLYSQSPLPAEIELDLNVPAFSSPFNSHVDRGAIITTMIVTREVALHWYVCETIS